MCIGDERKQIFRCVGYGVTLSNESMVPYKLKITFRTKS